MRPVRRWILIACIVVGSVAQSPEVRASEPAAAVETIDDQIATADAARREGRLADAARLYASVYRTMQASDVYRGSDIALDVAVLAASQYHEAFTASDRDYALCEESQRLLLEVEESWSAAGQPTPAPVTAELQWLEEQLAQRPVSEPVPEPIVEPPPPEPVEAPPEESIEPVGPQPLVDEPPVTPPPHRRDGLALALTAGGAVITATGAVLLGVAAPVRGRAEQYRTDTMAQPKFTERSPAAQDAFSQALDRYVDGERRRGIALMATGGALLGLGVAAVIVGSVRLVRHRRGSSRAAPVSLHPGRPGALAF